MMNVREEASEWRMPALQGWLVPFPDLQGTWQGEVRLTGSDADPSVPVPVVLVIKQTLSSMSVTMHTITSDSYSTTAQLSRNADGTLRLTYNYTNRPKAAVRDRFTIHDGAAILRVVLRPKRVLEGEYWTNHRTMGSITVRYRSRRIRSYA